MSLGLQKALESSYVMNTFARMPVEFVEGHGMTLVGDDGAEYRDFLAGIGVCSLGHCHPVLVEAIQRQAERLLHVSNYYYIERRGELAAILSKLASGDMDGALMIADAVRAGDEAAAVALGLPTENDQVWKTFFANSGAEANEGAMKLARLYAKRSGNGGNTIVALRGSFHGRTLETIAATMQDRLQDAFKPLPQDFLACTPNDVDELTALFEEHGSEICAVMVEPIQGESGVHPLTPEFFKAAHDLAHAHGALLIADEVQTGVFRSGKPFAFQAYGIEPDIMSLAKGIAGGVPMGAVMAKASVADAFNPGDHGTTFGGSALAVAASCAVLCELVRGEYDKHVQEVGDYMAARLAGLPHVIDVRGCGLMLGCDLDDAAGDAHDVVGAALASGFVINATGAHTLRFLPPLICERQDVDALIDALSAILV